jgi:hypothetical protein
LRDSKRRIVVEGKLFHCAADGVPFVSNASTNVTLVLVCTSCKGDGTGFKEGPFKVIE